MQTPYAKAAPKLWQIQPWVELLNGQVKINSEKLTDVYTPPLRVVLGHETKLFLITICVIKNIWGTVHQH